MEQTTESPEPQAPPVPEKSGSEETPDNGWSQGPDYDPREDLGPPRPEDTPQEEK